MEAICSGLCNSKSDVEDLLELLFFENVFTLNKELEWLINQKLISKGNFTLKLFSSIVVFILFIILEEYEESQKLRGTQLGRAILASSLSPDIALLIYDELERAIQSLALDNELHLLYLVTPLNNVPLWSNYINWHNFYNIWLKLPKQLLRVGRLIGISEKFFFERLQGLKVRSNRELQVHLRFLSSLALYELINERTLCEVAERFSINRGALQSLQQQSSTYACMIVAFCDRLGWNYLKIILEGFAERLMFGIRKDLTDLVKISGIDGKRARAFHNSHITTIASLAVTPKIEIAKILRSAVPFIKYHRSFAYYY
ncbi:unnamed protein product [Dracunculus medinensis]|uniref:POLQ-like helical domain-containing protein n=1 Tax=Dracunculus medinensis TaxID=318479 RepID=A0A3P7Q387_DRAME|nr:unnamed protein product [Dracunculus medinensis]